MIEASAYSTIYNVVVALLTIVLTQHYANMPDSRLLCRSSQISIGGWCLALTMALFIGFRPMSGYYFVDMANYRDHYYALFFGRPFKFNWESTNYLFDNLFQGMASSMWDISMFFVIIALIYFLCTYMAMTKFFPQDSFLGFVVFLGAFSTFSYSTNGIKAGAAAALFLCALAYRHKRLWCALFLFMTLGFHHSMVVPIAAFITCLFVRNPRIYFGFWIICFFLSAIHFSWFQELFAGMADESGAGYLKDTKSDWGGKSGFRIDFIIYSAVPIAIGYYAIFKKKLNSPDYNFLLNVYMLCNSVWMLCMYASFTNRIAYLSWLMYPVVLIYPFLHHRFMPSQYKTMNRVIWYQLLFTLGMNYIYYG